MKHHIWSEVVPRPPRLKTQLWEIALDNADKPGDEKQQLKRLYLILSLARLTVFPDAC